MKHPHTIIICSITVTSHMTLLTRPACLSVWNTEKLGVAWDNDRYTQILSLVSTNSTAVLYTHRWSGATAAVYMTHIVHVERDLDPLLGLIEGFHQAHHVECVQAVHNGGTHLAVLPKDGRGVSTSWYRLQLIVAPGILDVAIPRVPGHLRRCVQMCSEWSEWAKTMSYCGHNYKLM